MRDIRTQYKEVSTMTGHWIKNHLQDVQIAALGIFMIAFVAILAIAL
jgi:hypothetical protein